MEILGLILLGLMAVVLLLWAVSRLVFWLVVGVGLSLARLWPMKFIMVSGHDRHGEPVKLYREAVTGRIVAAHGGRWCQLRVEVPESRFGAVWGAV